MIGLILGTSEGKEILSLLNEFTEDIYVSTATDYGGSLLSDYKYKVLNTEPLDEEALVQAIKKNNIDIFVDASHPYALIISKNLKKACDRTDTLYVRYDRPSVIQEFIEDSHVICINEYEELERVLKGCKGNILNTSGSRNIKKILNLNLDNNIIHRVLPTLKVMEELDLLKIPPENIHAIKGPIGYKLNMAFIREYKVKAMIMKDSGIQGGTIEKIKSCIDSDIWAIIIMRIKDNSSNCFDDIEELLLYIRKIKKV